MIHVGETKESTQQMKVIAPQVFSGPETPPITENEPIHFVHKDKVAILRENLWKVWRQLTTSQKIGSCGVVGITVIVQVINGKNLVCEPQIIQLSFEVATEITSHLSSYFHRVRVNVKIPIESSVTILTTFAWAGKTTCVWISIETVEIPEMFKQFLWRVSTPVSLEFHCIDISIETFKLILETILFLLKIIERTMNDQLSTLKLECFRVNSRIRLIKEFKQLVETCNTRIFQVFHVAEKSSIRKVVPVEIHEGIRRGTGTRAPSLCFSNGNQMIWQIIASIYQRGSIGRSRLPWNHHGCESQFNHLSAQEVSSPFLQEESVFQRKIPNMNVKNFWGMIIKEVLDTHNIQSVSSIGVLGTEAINEGVGGHGGGFGLV